MATQALFKRCKRLNELCLSVKLDHFPLYVNEHSRSLKHLSIRSEPMSLNSNGMKLFSRLFPLQGFQSLRIKFSTFKSDEFTVNFFYCKVVFISTFRSCSKFLISYSNVHLLMKSAPFSCSILLPINMKGSQYAIFRQTFDFFDWLLTIVFIRLSFRLPSISYRLVSSAISGHYP